MESVQEAICLQRRTRQRKVYFLAEIFVGSQRERKREKKASCVPDILMRHVNRCSISAEREEKARTQTARFHGVSQGLFLPVRTVPSRVFTSGSTRILFRVEKQIRFSTCSLQTAVKTWPNASRECLLDKYNDIACVILDVSINSGFIFIPLNGVISMFYVLQVENFT